ncbi:MAG: hypothetical protein ACI8ZM_002914 [Crocinitomix sp.]|jgi:hypothetical protein
MQASAMQHCKGKNIQAEIQMQNMVNNWNFKFFPSETLMSASFIEENITKNFTLPLQIYLN